MKRLLFAFSSMSVGRLLWVNLAILVSLKILVPLGGSGLATITNQLGGFDLDRVIYQTNQERTTVQSPKLIRDNELDRAAQLKLDDMVVNGYFAHVSPSGAQPWDFIVRSGYSYQAAGENLARGFSDPDALVVAWMNSDSHRANLLSPGYSEVGIAGRRATIDERDSYVVVILFARPYGAAVAPAVSIPPTTPQPQVAAAVTVSPFPPKAQSVTTESSARVAQAPVRVVMRDDSVNHATVTAVSGWFATYLITILGALLLAAGWLGFRKHLVVGWVAHAALFIGLITIPSLHRVVSGTIF